MNQLQLTLGDRVEIIDDFNGHNIHICYAVVERLTRTLAVVSTENGNLDRFRLKNGQAVGYSFPSYTRVLRKTT